MSEIREEVQLLLAQALYDALSDNFEITWREGYRPAAAALAALGEVRERWVIDTGSIVIPVDEDEARRQSNRDWVKRYAELSIPLPVEKEESPNRD